MSHADQPTYYELLGVAATASDEQIRTAYRELAKHSHPDRGGNAALFRLIQIAYDTLKEPSERAAYDRSFGGDDSSRSDGRREPPSRPSSDPQADQGRADPTSSTDETDIGHAHGQLYFTLCDWLDENLGRALAGGTEVQTALDFLQLRLDSWLNSHSRVLDRTGFRSTIDVVNRLELLIATVRYSDPNAGHVVAKAVDDLAADLADLGGEQYTRRVNNRNPPTTSSDSPGSDRTRTASPSDVERRHISEFVSYLEQWSESHSNWYTGGSRREVRREVDRLLQAVCNWRERLVSGRDALPSDAILPTTMQTLAEAIRGSTPVAQGVLALAYIDDALSKLRPLIQSDPSSESAQGGPGRSGSDSARKAWDDSVSSIPEQILRLSELRDRGIISESEFQAKKVDLLGRM